MAIERAAQIMDKQIDLIIQLQELSKGALDRSDRASAESYIRLTQTAFVTFTEGIKDMAIDTSSLKSLLKSRTISPDVVKELIDRVTALEQQFAALDPTAIQSRMATVENSQKDVNVLTQRIVDLEDAFKELNQVAEEAAGVSVKL